MTHLFLQVRQGLALKSIFSNSILLLLGLHLLLSIGQAQSAANSGQIGGEVRDPSGLAVPAVEVTARNIDTNATRTVSTDEEGRYAIGPLPLGTYEVTVKAASMEAASQRVYVSLGGRANATFRLGMQSLHESVDVVVATGIEPAQTFSKAVLTEAQLRNLPAPGRRIKNLFLLTPATPIEPECGGFSISGQKGIYTNINVDGGDYTSSHWCGAAEISP